MGLNFEMIYFFFYKKKKILSASFKERIIIKIEAPCRTKKIKANN